MKKLIAFLLTFILVFTLTACTASEGGEEEAKGLQAGFARESIMPPSGKIALGGYGGAEFRISDSFLDTLYTTCIALRDDTGATVLLFQSDLLLITSTMENSGKASISEATGVPEENIFFAATHTHSGPAVSYAADGIEAYEMFWEEQCLKAAKAAIADLSPATMSMGSTELEGMNFVRHYIQESGAYVGSNFGDWNASPLAGHADTGDNEMQILKLARAAEDKKDILMMNWAAHPCLTDESGAGTNLSADYIATCRNYVEAQTDSLFAFYLGAAGNQNTFSRITSEDNGLGYKEYGEALGKVMVEQLDKLTPVADGSIQTQQFTYESPINKEDMDLLELAKEVQQKEKDADRTAANDLAKSYGFSSNYHANSVVLRSTLEGATPIEIHAVSIGGFSWVNAPYEMWASSAISIKEQTPFDMTFVITCSGAYIGYIPTEDAYEYGCYESHTSKLSPGTAEALVDHFVSMLGDMHAAAAE